MIAPDLTASERAKLAEKRNVTVKRAVEPSNRHVDDATIAAERVLERWRTRK